MVAKPKNVVPVKSKLGGALNKLSAVANLAVAPKQEDPNALKAVDFPIDKIIIKQQIRRKFNNIEELAATLDGDKEINQPIVLEDNKDGTATLIAGERRYHASVLANKKTIPSILKRDVDPLEFRRIQIQENIHREDLNAYEIAMGLQDDIGRFGRKETIKLWGKSESWISKRLAAANYLPETKYILEHGFSGDFEILNSMNQLEQLDPKEAKNYAWSFINGKSVDRSELANKVALRKRQAEEAAEYAAQQEKEIEERINTSQLSIIPDEESSAGHVQDKEAISKSLSVAADAILKNETVKSTTTSSASGEKVSAGKPGKSAVAAPKQKDEAKDIEGEIRQYRADFVEWGEGTRLELGNFFKSVKAGKMAPDQADLILWTLFLDHMLPMLDALGDQRSKIFIDKLTNLTRKQKMTPGEIFGLLHDGSAINEDIATIKMLGIQDLPESIKI